MSCLTVAQVRTLLPGLIDAHTHLAFDASALIRELVSGPGGSGVAEP